MANVSAKKTGNKKRKLKERDTTEKLDNSKQSQRHGLPTEFSSYSCCGVYDTMCAMPIANVLQTTQKFTILSKHSNVYILNFSSSACMVLPSTNLCHQFLRFCEAFQGSRESILDQVATACQNCYEQLVHNKRRTGFMLLTRELTS